jgi:hypothetical protein
MIVQQRGSELALITQPDHARLSAELLEAWRTPGWRDLPNRDDVLLAIGEHDNGWLEADAHPSVDTSGRPHDFVGSPNDVRQDVWPRGIGRLRATSVSAAALVAQHALTVYGRYRGNAAWTPFFDAIARLKEDLLAECDRAGLHQRATIDADYRWVHLGDTLSLVFCNRWTDRFDEMDYQTILTGDQLQVTPDPFEGRTVPFRVRARIIPDRRYLSDEDLHQTLAQTPDTWIAGTAAGSP